MGNRIVETFARFNLEVGLTPANLSGRNLPMLVRDSYRFFDAHLHDQRSRLLLAQPNNKFSVIELEKHHALFEKTADRPVIFVLEKLGTREKERLIKRGVPFLIPGKFIHAPVLGISCDAPGEMKGYKDLLKREKLSTWPEVLVIKQLLDGSIDGQSGIEIARHFGVTAIVISQAIQELEFHGLCVHARCGKSKRVEFEDRERLWWNCRRLIGNPVVGALAIGDIGVKLTKAGETALAHYSMLADTDEKIYAISKRELPAFERKGIITHKMLAEEKHKLQLWKRDPKLTAIDGFADPVSVYFSLRHSLDDRVQQEVERMMREIDLEIPDES